MTFTREEIESVVRDGIAWGFTMLATEEEVVRQDITEGDDDVRNVILLTTATAQHRMLRKNAADIILREGADVHRAVWEMCSKTFLDLQDYDDVHPVDDAWRTDRGEAVTMADIVDDVMTALKVPDDLLQHVERFSWRCPEPWAIIAQAVYQHRQDTTATDTTATDTTATDTTATDTTAEEVSDEERLMLALQSCLSPEAMTVVAAHLQVVANRRLPGIETVDMAIKDATWFLNLCVRTIGEASYNELMHELGL